MSEQKEYKTRSEVVNAIQFTAHTHPQDLVDFTNSKGWRKSRTPGSPLILARQNGQEFIVLIDDYVIKKENGWIETLSAVSFHTKYELVNE